jgi:hypothetical protein
MIHRRRLLALITGMGASSVLSAGAQPVFKRVERANLGGTAQEGQIEVSPRRLVRAFGPPTAEPWDSESLGAYYFESERGLFTVYYRASDLNSSAMQELKASFWLQAAPIVLSVGARGNRGVQEFTSWLFARVHENGA